MRTRRIVLVLGALVALLAMGAGAVRLRARWRTLPPNVILIVLDTLRADRVGTWNPSSRLTPFLDELAAGAIVYERAYAASSWTIPSVASIFVGEYPSEHQVVTMNAVLPYGAVTLAEALAERGYLGGGFSANFQVSAESGFGQGFKDYRTLFRDPKEDAAEVNRAALDWLEYVSTERRPFFLYLQYMEPHGPYRFHAGITAERGPDVGIDDDTLGKRVTKGGWQLAPTNPMPTEWDFTPAERRRLGELYDGEVAYLDQMLRRLFGELERRGRLADTLVVVTADHGEEFGEHGPYGHGATLFEPGIHVPLFIRLPGRTTPVRVSRPVTLAGIAPAVLHQLGFAVPASFRVPAIPLATEPTAGDASYAFAESADEGPSVLRFHQRAVVGQAHKMVVRKDGGHVFYDLASDPGEMQALATPPFAGELQQELVRFASALGTPAERLSPPVDAATRQRLRALGYGG